MHSIINEEIVENINIDKVKAYEKELRNNDESIDKVAESIKKFGWQQPIIIDNKNVIVAGNVMYKAAKKLGLSEVPCVRINDLSKEEIKKYRIADNKTAEISRWDYLGLAKEISTISGEELIDIGFSQGEINALTGLNKDMRASLEDDAVDGESEILDGGVYKPNYTPTFSKSSVTEDDVRTAEINEATRFIPKPENVVEYVCPRCGRKFEVRR